jgi:tetratricopeptide (TPR) repeat protein
MMSMPISVSMSMAPPSPPTGERRRQAIEALYATAHWLLSRERTHDASDVFRAMAFFAPADERAWLGLGSCHELMGQPNLALEIYGVGSALARSARCEVARSRTLRSTGREDAASEALERAESMAAEHDDDAALALVRQERGTP